jgi:histone H3/H4
MQEYEKPVVIVKSAVKNWYKGRKIRVSALAYRKVNDEVILLLEKSLRRCLESKRRTIKPQDV